MHEQLVSRSGNLCELCAGTTGLHAFEVTGTNGSGIDTSVLICEVCSAQLGEGAVLDKDHWRCLNNSMWSEYTPVQVLSYRLLYRLKQEGWARELLEQMYLDDEVLIWAKAELPKESDRDSIRTLDSNGTELQEGDSVTLIKDLDVKGAGFTAKRGTLVKKISLTDNPEHIEGKVNGVQIVLKTCFLKKVIA